jgi:cell division septum initiation protein DivIVA
MFGMAAPRIVPAHGEPIVEPRNSDNAVFDSVLRGYDRRQVDQRIRQLTDDLDLLGAEHRKSTAAAAAAVNRAHAAEQELRAVRAELDEARQAGSADARSGFGYRAERILRAAEDEAAGLRASAAQEVAALIEQARADAEQRRHEAEQQMIEHAAVLDYEATKRIADIAEREQAVAAAAEAARRDAEEVRSSANRAAEQVTTQAEKLAKEIRIEADRYLRQQKEVAERELARLASIGSDARAELSRLHKLLEAEVQTGADGLETQTGLPDG